MPFPIVRPSRSWFLGLLLMILFVCARAVTVAAQTTFQYTHTYPPVDVVTYRNVEECVTAIDRLRGEGIQSNLRRTAPWEPLPDTVRWTANRCGARYAPTDSVFRDYPLGLLFSFLAVGQRDADLAAAVAQGTTMLPAADTVARREIEDTLLDAYRGARQRAAVQRILEDRLRRTSDPTIRMKAHYDLFTFNDEAGDSAMGLAHATQLVTEAAVRTPQSNRSQVFVALKRVHHQALLDSLGQSTASYIRALYGLWARAIQPMVDSNAFNKGVLGGIGQPAPAIIGDFWFRWSDSTQPRPIPGKVNLIVFLDRVVGTRMADQFQGGCLPAAATLEEAEVRYTGPSGDICRNLLPLRALAQRFPTVEITLVGRTMNRFVAGAAPDPAKEAALLERAMFDDLQLPGALAVKIGPFRRLPRYDRRVYYDSDTNDVQYANIGDRVLVDRDGIVVDGGNSDGFLSNEWGGVFAERITATLRQTESSGPSQGAPPKRPAGP